MQQLSIVIVAIIVLHIHIAWIFLMRISTMVAASTAADSAVASIDSIDSGVGRNIHLPLQQVE